MAKITRIETTGAPPFCGGIWWHWAIKTPAAREALKHLGCTVNVEAPGFEIPIVVYESYWRAQPWIDAGVVPTETDNQFGGSVTKIHQIMGEMCGTFYCEIVKYVDNSVQYLSRAMIGVNSDGARAVVLEFDR